MCKTIKLKVKFRSEPQIVYALITDAKKLRSITGKATSIDSKVGGRFSCYGGDAIGINVDLLPGKRIVQAWRHKKFPEGIFSMATFNLAVTRDGGTELTLTHRGVPKELIPQISAEWRDLYWDKMKAYLANSARKRV